METYVRAAVVGDEHPGIAAYDEICAALEHASQLLSINVKTRWLPTHILSHNIDREFDRYDAFWCGPWGPYENATAALQLIQRMRESGKPLLGTCAGFQHVVIEYARTVLGITNADHAESNPAAVPSVIARLARPLLERTGAVALDPSSRVARIYRRTISAERYRCQFGLNPVYLSQLHSAGLRVSGVDEVGMATVVELPSHPFFVATLFLPELSTRAGSPHPLITAWLRVAAEKSGVRC